MEDLETLNENIVRKHKDSLDNLKLLHHDVELVHSEINNLINSLQMVGNKQFTENRVQEDDLLDARTHMRKDLSAAPSYGIGIRDRSSSQNTSSFSSTKTIGDILRKAIKLVPKQQVERGVSPEIDQKEEDEEEEEEDENQVHSSVRIEAEPTGDKTRESRVEETIKTGYQETEATKSSAPPPPPPPPPPPIPPHLLLPSPPGINPRQPLVNSQPSSRKLPEPPSRPPILKISSPQENQLPPSPPQPRSPRRETTPPRPARQPMDLIQALQKHQREQVQHMQNELASAATSVTQQEKLQEHVVEPQKTANPPSNVKMEVDRDRVTDILKRYSLYDDDDDDEEDEDGESVWN